MEVFFLPPTHNINLNSQILEANQTYSMFGLIWVIFSQSHLKT